MVRDGLKDWRDQSLNRLPEAFYSSPQYRTWAAGQRPWDFNRSADSLFMEVEAGNPAGAGMSTAWRRRNRDVMWAPGGRATEEMRDRNPTRAYSA